MSCFSWLLATEHLLFARLHQKAIRSGGPLTGCDGVAGEGDWCRRQQPFGYLAVAL